MRTPTPSSTAVSTPSDSAASENQNTPSGGKSTFGALVFRGNARRKSLPACIASYTGASQQPNNNNNNNPSLFQIKCNTLINVRFTWSCYET